jgi:hypothetical protein
MKKIEFPLNGGWAGSGLADKTFQAERSDLSSRGKVSSFSHGFIDFQTSILMIIHLKKRLVRGWRPLGRIMERLFSYSPRQKKMQLHRQI